MVYTKSKPKKDPVSLGKLQADKENEYLRTKNLELSKEIAELRMEKAGMQSDIDYLLAENFKADVKFNNLNQIVLRIDNISKVCFNKFVECTTELTHILKLTNSIKNSDKGELLNVPGTLQTNSVGSKQVSTPHAQNEYQLSNTTGTSQRSAKGPNQVVSPRSVVTPHTPVTSHTPVKSRAVVTPHTVNSCVVQTPLSHNGSVNQTALEHSESDGEMGQSYDEEESELDEDDNKEPIDDDDVDSIGENEEEGDRLSPIEELSELSDASSVKQVSTVTDRQEKNRYLDRSSFNSPQLKNPRRTCSLSSDAEKSFSSIAVEASTSLDRTLTSQTANAACSSRVDEQSPRKNSFVERKSIGSPFPERVTYRKRSRKSTSSTDTSSQCDASSNTIIQSLDTNIPVEVPNTTRLSLSTMNSFLEKTSIHSTPLVNSSNSRFNSSMDSTTRQSNVTIKKDQLSKANLVPIVQLVRLTPKEKMRCSNSHSETSDASESSKGKAVRKRKAETTKSSLKENSTPKVKTEQSTPDHDAVESTGAKRPRRAAAKLISLKEPRLNFKLRRSR